MTKKARIEARGEIKRVRKHTRPNVADQASCRALIGLAEGPLCLTTANQDVLARGLSLVLVSVAASAVPCINKG